MYNANFQKTIIHQISKSKDLTSSTESLSGPWFNAAGLLRYVKELSAQFGISTQLPILHDTKQSNISVIGSKRVTMKVIENYCSIELKGNI